MGVIRHGILEDFQRHIRLRMQTCNEFCGIYIATNIGDFESWMEYFIRSGNDIGIYIATPSPVSIIEGVAGPVWDRVEFEVKVIENTLTNTSNRSAVNIAEKICGYLHLQAIGLEHWHGKIALKRSDNWEQKFEYGHSEVTLRFEGMLSL